MEKTDNTLSVLKAALNPYGLDVEDLRPSTNAFAIVDLGVEESSWHGVVWIHGRHARITHIREEIYPYCENDLAELVTKYATLHLGKKLNH